MASEEQESTIGPILGRVPSGVFILVAGNDSGQQTGMLASWVQQASFEPPQVTVAVNQSRYLNEWLTDGSAVTLNQVAKGDGVLFKHFGKGFEPDENAFDDVETETGTTGLPLLKAAMASMEGTVRGAIESGDHVIYMVEITSATAHQAPEEFDPFVHIRKNGFNY